VLKLPRLPLAFSIALLAPVLTAQTGAAPDVNTKRKQPNGRLELAGSLVVKSELAESFVDPIKCDDDGNVYLMTQIEASSGIRKISPKGQRLALFSASSATDVHVWHATYFSLDQDGRVYQLADLHDKLDRAVVVYGKDGSYKSTIKLDFPPGAHDWYACPASSILSGQRQLDFPMLFERYQQQSGLWEKWESRGFCGISKGGGKGGKPAFGFPRFPPPGFFHSPLAAAFLLLKKSSMFTLLLRTPSQHPDSSWLVPCGNSGCSVPGLRNDGRDDRLRPRWSSRL